MLHFYNIYLLRVNVFLRTFVCCRCSVSFVLAHQNALHYTVADIVFAMSLCSTLLFVVLVGASQQAVGLQLLHPLGSR